MCGSNFYGSDVREKFSAFRSLEFALDRTKRVKNQRKHKITSHDTKQKSNMADFY